MKELKPRMTKYSWEPYVCHKDQHSDLVKQAHCIHHLRQVNKHKQLLLMRASNRSHCTIVYLCDEVQILTLGSHRLGYMTVTGCEPDCGTCLHSKFRTTLQHTTLKTETAFTNN